MARMLAAPVLLSLLAGCSGMPDWSLFGPEFLQPKTVQAARYNFGWVLAGNQRVAPLQVFDDGRRTWLQFAPQQAVPAIFSQGLEGDSPLVYRREGPYVVLPGVWPRLVLRGGHLSSTVERAIPAVSPSKTPTLEPAQISPVAAPVLAVDDAAPKTPKNNDEASDLTTASLALFPTESPLPSTSDDTASGLPLQSPSQPFSVSAELSHYKVGPADATMRAALVRWARQAGWTFEPEHWAVEADIPIVGSASFDLEFKPAVQQLVASTELADRPLQPCFYSNRVLRVVPYAQACDRTVGAARPS